MSWILAIKLIGALAGVIALGVNIHQALEARAIRRNAQRLRERR